MLGLCVGTPGYFPLVVLNSSCEDVTGVSGRRVTLAHELCHLLFDRAGLRASPDLKVVGPIATA